MVSSGPILSRRATLTDIPEIMRIERESFAVSIQESSEVFVKRIRVCEGFVRVLEMIDSPAATRTIGYLSAELTHLPAAPHASLFSLGHDPATTHRPDGDTLYVSSFAIEEKSRGGMGKLCFSLALKDIVKEHPVIGKVSLLVNEEWRSAHRIYTSLGFKERSVFPLFFMEGNHAANAIYMELRL